MLITSYQPLQKSQSIDFGGIPKEAAAFSERQEKDLTPQQNKLLQSFKENPQTIFKAVVVRLMKYGAYLEVEGVSVFLENISYSKRPVRIMDELEVGDCLPVQLIESYGKKICVKIATLEESNFYTLSFEELVPEQIVLGLVRSKKEDKIFVCLAPGLDGITPHSNYFDVEEGDLVCFRINQVREDGRVRGKVVRNLTAN